MKPNIHPHYRTVVFHDTSANEYFKVGSTIRTEREIELEGETYPYVTLDVSSKSHRITPANRRPSTMKAAPRVSASASAVLLMRKGVNNAGAQLIA